MNGRAAIQLRWVNCSHGYSFDTLGLRGLSAQNVGEAAKPLASSWCPCSISASLIDSVFLIR